MDRIERYKLLRIIFIVLTAFFFIVFLIGLMAAITYEPHHTLGPAMAGFFYMMCSMFFLFFFVVSLFVTRAVSKRLNNMILNEEQYRT